MWQPRCNSSRTSSLYGPLLFVWTCASVLCECYDTCVYHGRCVRVCVIVCWNPTFQLFVLWLCSLLLLLLLMPYHAVCITPSLKLFRSIFCGRHGTTAVAQHHLHIRVCCVLCVLRVCYDTCACVGVCAGLRICELSYWVLIMSFIFFFLSVLLY